MKRNLKAVKADGADVSRNILITIKYDGTGFFGWQKQPELPTVQGEIESALEKLLGVPTEINGTGRTDRGVHAYGQCATFTAPCGIPAERIPYALTNLLPEGIEITGAREVPSGFHARFSAKGKTYVYKIVCDANASKSVCEENKKDKPRLSMFLRNYCCYVAEKLDLCAMREAAKHIEGTHDFAAFQAAGGEEKETTVRTVYSAKVSEETVKNGILDEEGSAKLITIEVTGDGFLYNMVRIIAGTLIDTGLGKMSPEDVRYAIASCDRSKAGHTAPACGLYLKKVYFDEDELPKWNF